MSELPNTEQPVLIDESPLSDPAFKAEIDEIYSTIERNIAKQYDQGENIKQAMLVKKLLEVSQRKRSEGKYDQAFYAAELMDSQPIWVGTDSAENEISNTISDAKFFAEKENKVFDIATPLNRMLNRAREKKAPELRARSAYYVAYMQANYKIDCSSAFELLDETVQEPNHESAFFDWCNQAKGLIEYHNLNRSTETYIKKMVSFAYQIAASEFGKDDAIRMLRILAKQKSISDKDREKYLAEAERLKPLAEIQKILFDAQYHADPSKAGYNPSEAILEYFKLVENKNVPKPDRSKYVQEAKKLNAILPDSHTKRDFGERIAMLERYFLPEGSE